MLSIAWFAVFANTRTSIYVTGINTGGKKLSFFKWLLSSREETGVEKPYLLHVEFSDKDKRVFRVMDDFLQSGGLSLALESGEWLFIPWHRIELITRNPDGG